MKQTSNSKNIGTSIIVLAAFALSGCSANNIGFSSNGSTAAGSSAPSGGLTPAGGSSPDSTSSPGTTTTAPTASCGNNDFGTVCTNTPGTNTPGSNGPTSGPLPVIAATGAHAFLYNLTPIMGSPGWATPANTAGDQYAGLKTSASMSLLNSASVVSDADVYTNSINVGVTFWTSGFPNLPSLTEWFGLCYEGTWTAPAAGTYTIYTAVDDGMAVWIDGNLLGENDDGNLYASLNPRYPGLAYNNEPVAFPSVTLSAGPHSVKVMYYQAWPFKLRAQVFVVEGAANSSTAASLGDSQIMQLSSPNGALTCPSY